MKTHKCKLYPAYFDAIDSGKKPFDVRIDDRTPKYKVGDNILFQEYSPSLKEYSGRETLKNITYKLDGGDWGIDDDCCVLGLANTDVKNIHGREELIKQLKRVIKGYEDIIGYLGFNEPHEENDVIIAHIAGIAKESIKNAGVKI